MAVENKCSAFYLPDADGVGPCKLAGEGSKVAENAPRLLPATPGSAILGAA